MLLRDEKAKRQIVRRLQHVPEFRQDETNPSSLTQMLRRCPSVAFCNMHLYPPRLSRCYSPPLVSGVARARNQLAARSLPPISMPTPGLEPLRFADSALEPIDWNALDGWAMDDHAAAFATFQSSCRPLLRTIPPKCEMRPMYFALTHVCRQALAAGRLAREQARDVLRTQFPPSAHNQAG